MGVLGGYGQFAKNNERSEFNLAAGAWEILEPDRADRVEPGPCRRSLDFPPIPDATGRRLFVVGGEGSRSGKQGEQTPGWRGYNGQFHYLDDVWELNLATNAWRCVLPPGCFDPRGLRAAAYFPAVEGLVLFEGLGANVVNSEPARTWLLRPGRDRKPIRLPAEGEPSRLARAWAWTFDPRDGDLLMFADDGIFRLALKLA